MSKVMSLVINTTLVGAFFVGFFTVSVNTGHDQAQLRGISISMQASNDIIETQDIPVHHSLIG